MVNNFSLYINVLVKLRRPCDSHRCCGSCGIACIYAFCSSMRLSRCRKIRCLCFSCDRDLETAEEIAMELEHQQAAPSAAV